MPGIENNLYPPILDTWAPAFVRISACRVYFSLSNYNSINDIDINKTQIIVNSQNTNLSVLNAETYPSGIKISSIAVDESVQGDNRYYVTISPSDIDGGFELNQFYKVQIRFTGVGATALPSDSKGLAPWLINNQSRFSEWSTVCIIKGIEQPLIYIKGFEDANDQTVVTFTSDTIRFVGKMYYENNAELEKEYLKSYQIDIYNDSSGELVGSSGIVYTEVYNPNEINYTFPYSFEDGLTYRAEVSYVTNNGYQGSATFVFNIIIVTIDALNARITASADEEYGRIKVDIVSEEETYIGNLAIRRTSSKSDFKIWEDVKILVLLGDGKINISWYDYTVESGILYRYCAQKINLNEDRGAAIKTINPVMIVLDDMFLTQEDFQLKIKYNPSVSSFKHTLSESITETIGSKYPFFKRNGKVNYRQFPISGLITHFCDEDGVFLSKDNIYTEESRFYYDNYNEENNIDEYQDYIYEREFRNKIIDFLYQDNVKLFRSTTEGNILVKLMDVTFTPNETLGRMLYTFSATAYEVDECSIESYSKYKISDTGSFNPNIEQIFDKLGQKAGPFAASEDVVAAIQKDITDTQTQSYTDTVKYLTWLRLCFQSDPYPVRILPNGTMEPLLNKRPDNDCLLGYIVYINNNPIFVNRKGYYELFDDDVKVTSITFPIQTDVLVDYIGEIDRNAGMGSSGGGGGAVAKLSSSVRAGQICGLFDLEKSVSQELLLKYHEKYSSYYQDLLSIDKISIEALPGTVIFIKDSFDDTYERHVIGETSRLTLYKDDAVFMGFYFKGIHLLECTDDTPRTFEYLDTKVSVQNANQIENIIVNGVYTIGGARKIYYSGDWYDFDENNDVQCPVEAMIDYEYELLRGEYQA